MGSFATGFCVGLGLSLLFTPMKGEEMRRLVGERIRYLRGTPPENQQLSPSVAQMGARLQEVQNRAEPTRPMGATPPTASPIQQTASSTEEVQQELNRAAQQMGTTTPGAVEETPSSVEETQTDLNRIMRQPGTDNPPPPRRPRS